MSVSPLDVAPAQPTTAQPTMSGPATVPVSGLSVLQNSESGCMYDRERIMNDMTNTGTVGALIGGFALSIFDRSFSRDGLEFATGVIIFISVHLCTFSALSAAIIYRRVNRMSEEETVKFVQKWEFVMRMPQAVFVVGCLCYLCGVILLGVVNNGGTSAHYSYPLTFTVCGGLCVGMIGWILVAVQ